MKKILRNIISVSLFFCVSFDPVLAQSPPNTITFDNQSGEFAVVKLIGPTQAAVEVPNDQKRTVHVNAGNYYLLGRYGSPPKEFKYTKGDPFEVIQSGREYSIITITLHRVIDGNYHAEPVSGNEFEKTLVGTQASSKVQKPREKVTVIFQDGERLDITEWNFVYEFDKWDHPPGPTEYRGYFVGESRPSLNTRDLLLNLGTKTRRGVTFTNNRRISKNDLAAIKFVKNGVIVTLINGEILKLPSLTPSERLIKQERKITADTYLDKEKLYLKGQAQLEGHTGEFRKRLDWQPTKEDPSEEIVEIRFLGKRDNL